MSTWDFLNPIFNSKGVCVKFLARISRGAPEIKLFNIQGLISIVEDMIQSDWRLAGHWRRCMSSLRLREGCGRACKFWSLNLQKFHMTWETFTFLLTIHSSWNQLQCNRPDASIWIWSCSFCVLPSFDGSVWPQGPTFEPKPWGWMVTPPKNDPWFSWTTGNTGHFSGLYPKNPKSGDKCAWQHNRGLCFTMFHGVVSKGFTSPRASGRWDVAGGRCGTWKRLEALGVCVGRGNWMDWLHVECMLLVYCSPWLLAFFSGDEKFTAKNGDSKKPL